MWEDERGIECPKHGSTFSLCTGEPQTLPATRPRPCSKHGARRGRRRVRGAPVTTLVVEDLHARVNEVEVLRGVDLTVRSGRCTRMGPNGSGKSTLSHVVMGRVKDYEVTSGSVRLDDTELLGLPTRRGGPSSASSSPCSIPWRCRAYPSVRPSPRPCRRGRPRRRRRRRVARRATLLEVPDEFLTRGVNDEFSGGEQKRMETLQLAVLSPRSRCLTTSTRGSTSTHCAKLAQRVVAMTRDADLGVLAITHYARPSRAASRPGARAHGGTRA